MAFPLLLLLATAASANQQRNAAKAQEIELEVAAEQEELSAEAKELGRRQRLNKVLSSNIVAQVTSGTTGEGTPQSIALANAKTASASEGLEGLSSRLRQAQLRRRAASVGKQGDLQAASTLLKGGVQAAQLG